MNNEQNIDDILKLLKSSYGEEGSEAVAEPEELEEDAEALVSHDNLQDILKQRFMSGENVRTDAVDDEGYSFSYALDDDILMGGETEAESEEEDTVIDETEREEVIELSEEEKIPEAQADTSVISVKVEAEEEEDDGIPPFDLEPEDDPLDVLAEFFDDSDTPDTDELVYDEEDGIFVENEYGEIVLVKEEGASDAPAFEEEAEDISLEEMAEPSEEESIDLEELLGDGDEKEEIELFSDESGQLAIFDMVEDVSTYDEEKESTAPDAEDTLQIAMDFGETIQEEEPENAVNDADGAEDKAVYIDDSMLGVMLEFGDVSALEASVSAERIDGYMSKKAKEEASYIDPSEAFAFDGDEFENEDQKDELVHSYGRERLFTGLRVLGCAVFTLLLLFYELFSAFDVDYPAVYMLIGMQLLVFSAAFAWRELWTGFKRAFTFKADKWSFVSVVCAFTLVYGAVIAVTSPSRISYTFGTLTSVYILIGLIFEFLEVNREIKCFEIYSSEEKKFTVSTKAGGGSCAEKMYRGGVSRNSRIFEPRTIDFPRGYFSAVNRSQGTDKLITYSIAPAIISAAVALVVCAMLGSPADGAIAAFMCVLVALCPLSSFAVHNLLIYKTSSYLYGRGSAVAGEVMATKYAECDYMVFGDMHLFRRASAENNGIVIYDEKNSSRVVGYLDALYGAIGGPMSEIFSGALSAKHTVKLRRIAKNGVEAAIDGAHSLILGDADFCRRYGIIFEGLENTKEGDGILGFAIDGRPAAKLCCRYKCEPVFEMLLEKMGEAGIRCAIETYDPAINSAFAASCRERKANPVNVIHKNAADYYGADQSFLNEDTGLVVCASRLKLVESVVWCKRFCRALRICTIFQCISSGLIFAALAALVVLGHIGAVNQYYLLLAQALTMLPTFVTMLVGFPKKNHFSVQN